MLKFCSKTFVWDPLVIGYTTEDRLMAAAVYILPQEYRPSGCYEAPEGGHTIGHHL